MFESISFNGLLSSCLTTTSPPDIYLYGLFDAQCVLRVRIYFDGQWEEII